VSDPRSARRGCCRIAPGTALAITAKGSSIPAGGGSWSVVLGLLVGAGACRPVNPNEGRTHPGARVHRRSRITRARSSSVGLVGCGRREEDGSFPLLLSGRPRSRVESGVVTAGGGGQRLESERSNKPSPPLIEAVPRTSKTSSKCFGLVTIRACSSRPPAPNRRAEPRLKGATEGSADPNRLP
jgi:hypothetical protein